MDTSIENKIIQFFHKHLVLMLFTYQKGEQQGQTIVTAFVISVQDKWFLVTAGHCLIEIDKWIENGYEVKCFLLDSLGEGAKNNDPIPFDHYLKMTVIKEGIPFDCGTISISLYYKEMLKANNIQPLNEEVWEIPPPRADSHFLLGLAAENVKFGIEYANVTPTLHPITFMEEIPSGFTRYKGDSILFYGEIIIGEMESIKGISGAPIFTVYHNEEKNETRYFLTAIQSRWLPESHYIAAFPTYLLGRYISEYIN